MRTGLKSILAYLYRDFVMRTGINAHATFDVYNYMFDPGQLRFLMDCITETAQITGCYVEAGCARGATTVFLRKWMDDSRIKKKYFALDTFSGFPSDQTEYEVHVRGKPTGIGHPFAINRKEWFDFSLSLAKVTDVNSIQTDVSNFNFDTIAPISFCLLDVDLYLPIRKCLPRIFNNMSAGGIIVVDDCVPRSLYDGALQAYEEFVVSQNITTRIECGKLGVIVKY
jgi:O-methyltransferase